VVTDQQVRRLMTSLKEGESLVQAASRLPFHDSDAFAAVLELHLIH